MRYISIETVEPGQVLARGIFASDGRNLLNAGVQLTVGMINKLTNIGVTRLYIEDERFDDIHFNDAISEETRRSALKNISEMVHFVQSGKDFAVKNLQASVQNIISEILANREILIELGDVRTVENKYFIHALNVCLMSVVTGINLHLNHTQLYDLAVGALLHDLGKWVKDEEADQPGVIKETHHAWKGFNYLRKKREVSILSAHIALQHHEYIDGSGGPRGVKDEELHIFGKIVAVANHYDNLINPFHEETKALLPYQACEYLMGMSGKKFDHEVVRQFLRSVAVYPTGATVRLTTGEIAIVVEQHKGLPARPILRSFHAHHEETEVKEIDLAKETTLFIDRILI